jgi:hypothetical protein
MPLVMEMMFVLMQGDGARQTWEAREYLAEFAALETTLTARAERTGVTS